MNSIPTLLVTGASGHLGRQVIENLKKTAGFNLVAGTRDPSKMPDPGIELRVVDFDNPTTLAIAFAGVDRLLLISTDALDKPGRRIAQHRAAISAAVAAGVKHVVYTSVINAVEDSASLVTPDHYETEQAIIASGLGYTILRNGLYADNLLGSLPHIVSSGQWYHSAGKGKIALVTRFDCARIAAAALTGEFNGKRILDVTGPELLDHDEIAGQIGGVIGRPIEAISIDAESLVEGMTQAGLPEQFARVLASFDIAQANGEFAVLSPSILKLTGVAPTSVREFLEENRTSYSH